MKKNLAGIAAATGLLLGVTGYAVYAEDESVHLGDVNNDTVIAADDALEILNMVIGINNQLNLDQMKAADVNNDSIISTDDSLLVLQYVAGIIDSFDKKETSQTTTLPSETTESIQTTVPSDTTNESDSSVVNIWSVVTTELSSDDTELTTNSDTAVSENISTTTTVTTIQTTVSTTVTTTETTVTTTAQLPRSYKIDGVTPIVQRGLPTGCEATGLTIALNWYGFNVSKEKVALQYMPRQDFTYSNGKKIGADFIYTFAGDPTRSSNSYGCYIPCMTQTVANYFNDIGCKDYTTADISGTTLDNLFYYVANNTPVMVLTSNNLVTPVQGDSWYTTDGRRVTWQKGHHCMVITGYNYNTNTVTVSESAYSTEQTYNMDKFRNVYNIKGKNAMIIKKTSASVDVTPDVYVTPFADGDICVIKNSASGKLLNVDYGKDANDTNVYQWSADNSTEQKFKMNLQSDGTYMIRTMCSSDGTNRTLDIQKKNGNIVSGGNVDIYNPTDLIAQKWLFVKTSDNTYKIVPAYNKKLALTVYGNSNGSAGGTSPTSAGNAFVSDYIGSSYQQWIITKIN